MKLARVVLPLLAVALAPAGTAVAKLPAAKGPLLVRITSTPALVPAYSPSVHDYVVRCNDGTPVRFTTWSAAGTEAAIGGARSEEHTSELQSRRDLVCRLLLEKKKASLIPGISSTHTAVF